MSGGAMWGGIAQAAAGAMSIFDNMANRATTRSINERNNQNAWDMWSQNNLYNSPAEIVKRLKAAGLNPNLAYGSGGATNTADMAKVPEWEQPPPLNIGATMSNSIANYMQMEQTEQAIDESQSREAMNRANLPKIAAEVGAIISNTAKTDQEVSQGREMFQYSTDYIKQQIRTAMLKNDEQTFVNSKLDENQKIKVRQANADVLHTFQQIKQSKSQVRKIDVETVIDKYKADLWKQGINPDDAAISRFIEKALNRIFPELNEADTHNDTWKVRKRKAAGGLRALNPLNYFKF